MDVALELIAIAAALASGVALALLNVVMGDFITVLTDFVSGASTRDKFMSDVSTYCMYFVYIGIARLCLAYIYTTLTTYCAYHIVRNIRTAYLKAALSQEIAFFDVGSGGSISSKSCRTHPSSSWS